MGRKSINTQLSCLERGLNSQKSTKLIVLEYMWNVGSRSRYVPKYNWITFMYQSEFIDRVVTHQH